MTALNVPLLARGLVRRSLALAAPFVRAEVPVLNYHSVDNAGSVLSVSPAALGAQLAHLHAEGWRSLSLADYLAAPPGQRHARAMLITFDDGYGNFVASALPLLRQFGFTATLFVPVDYVGKCPSWLESNHATARLLLNQLGFPGRERQQLEDGMTALARDPLLDWPALRELVAAGIDVQSHGAGHSFLTGLRPDEAAADLARSRSVLEDRLGAPVRTIAYPYGACNAAVAALAQQAGFAAGFISDYGPRDTGGLMRWRAGISSLTTPRELSAMMASWPLHPRLRSLARRVDLARPT